MTPEFNTYREISLDNSAAKIDSSRLPEFGDYVEIEMHRYGAENEMYLHKVIGRDGSSNAYVDVPVKGVTEETRHDNIISVVRCVCCGVDERQIFKYRVEDVKLYVSQE